MALEIGLLGTIAVHRDGRRIDLAGDRLRTLLAYLALGRGSSRSMEGIIDALWPVDDLVMPVDPRQTVHTYVSRMRRALGHSALVSREGGYALDIVALDIDVSRFEKFVQSAGDPGCSSARRVELLGRGLSLWRGRALDGVHECDWARPDAIRLTEMRAIAEDDRAEALVTLGDAVSAVPLLLAAAAVSPLRERSRMLLMTGLHRCGREAEALCVFQEYRNRLGLELGLEPGPAIINVERSIASGKPFARAVATSDRVAPRYVLEERIGEEAFAGAYRGCQTSVGRDAAIKVIRAELADQPEFVPRFEAEAQLVAHLERSLMIRDHRRVDPDRHHKISSPVDSRSGVLHLESPATHVGPRTARC
jgi:DNA-binding SARP family transcriptional activator